MEKFSTGIGQMHFVSMTKRYSRRVYLNLPSFWSGFTSVADLTGVSSLNSSLALSRYPPQANPLQSLLTDSERMYEDALAICRDFDEAIEHLDTTTKR